MCSRWFAPRPATALATSPFTLRPRRCWTGRASSCAYGGGPARRRTGAADCRNARISSSGLSPTSMPHRCGKTVDTRLVGQRLEVFRDIWTKVSVEHRAGGARGRQSRGPRAQLTSHEHAHQNFPRCRRGAGFAGRARPDQAGRCRWLVGRRRAVCSGGPGIAERGCTPRSSRSSNDIARDMELVRIRLESEPADRFRQRVPFVPAVRRADRDCVGRASTAASGTASSSTAGAVSDPSPASPARWLIVNADDFGLSRGVNAGIIAARTNTASSPAPA